MAIPRSTKVPITDGVYAPKYETLRKIFWLHCRHSSVTYIGRMVQMLDAFTKGFSDYLSKDTDPAEFAGFLRGCYRCLNDHKEGLARLRNADHSGFKLIRGGMSFRDPFYDRVTEYAFEPLGYHGDDKPSEALWTWMEKGIPLTLNIEGTLRGRKSLPLFDVSAYPFPDQIGGYPFVRDIFIQNGEDIPITGVWQPKNLKGGCPNFLIQGEKAPMANLPILRTDTPAWDERMKDGSINHHEAKSEFDLGKFPAVWQLVWEDDRWRNGREPIGEDDYLIGPDTDLPKEPPVALRDPPKFP